MKKQDSFDALLPHVAKASRYLGNEINAVKKDRASVDITFALAFPDAYEVGMSHLGLHILYSVLNARDTIACERVFAPWPDMEAEMRRHGLPLSTLESRIPLGDCDIIGFSLEYELSYATVLRMLDLAGVPLQSAERDKTKPLVIAGGPSTYNPEPVADFFDAFVIGEGEEVILEICDAVRSWKASGGSKQDLLDMLAGIKGVYVPSFFHMSWNEDGTLREIVPLRQGYTSVRKRIISDFNAAPCCTAPVVPYMQIIHDRAAVEIARGCSRGCRFCMAGMIYRPVREKSIDTVMALAEESLARTGYEELGLASLSSGDYSGIQKVISLLMRRRSRDKVALSLPSLRVATLTRDIMEAIKQVRKTGFTIAPEAGTQRLRDIINKNITEEEILRTSEQIFAAGWNLVKLYFMIGLPTETEEDIEGIVALCRNIASLNRRKQLNVSISTFVPKPHTPFQWEAQAPYDAIREKQHYLRSRLHGKQIQVKCHSREVSLLEGVFSRGNRRLAAVLLHAHRSGAGFEAWTEYFSPGLWEQSFAACSIDTQAYLRERGINELLPWSHLTCGVSEEFLKQERLKAYAGEITPDCRKGSCAACGLSCPSTPAAQPDNPAVPPQVCAPAAKTPPAFRYRLVYSKTGPARFLSHLELGRAFARAFRRAGLPLKYSMGFHPLPRIIFYEALPVGMESLGEYCDIELSERIPPLHIAEKAGGQLPEGITIISAEELSAKKSPLAGAAKIYRIQFPCNSSPPFPDERQLHTFVSEFAASTAYPVQIMKGGDEVPMDIKKIIRSARCSGSLTLELELYPAEGKTPRIAEIAAAIFNIGQTDQKVLHVTKCRYPI